MGVTMKLIIRDAKEPDLKEIVEIFNQAIRTQASVGYTGEVTVEERTDWFKNHSNDRYPIYVAEQNHEIVGWISINPYRKGRDAFKKTGEVDCFVRNEWKGKGIGNELVQHLLRQAQRLGYRTLIAIVLGHNIASRKLLEKHKFEQWGLLPGIGEIDGNIVSHVYYGKRL